MIHIERSTVTIHLVTDRGETVALFPAQFDRARAERLAVICQGVINGELVAVETKTLETLRMGARRN